MLIKTGVIYYYQLFKQILSADFIHKVIKYKDWQRIKIPLYNIHISYKSNKNAALQYVFI